MTTAKTDDMRRVARGFLPQIAAARSGFDRERRLPDALVAELAAAGLFRLAVPASLGGLEVDPLTLFDVIEELSYADGAVGWVVAIGAGTACILGAGLSEEGLAAIYGRDPLVVTCGSVAVPSGRALPVEGGHRISGRWAYGSGSLHSSWLAAQCLVMDGDAPRLTETGTPETRIIAFAAGDCEVLDTWHVSGLRGTGSNDYADRDLFVPATMSFRPGELSAGAIPLHRVRFFLFVHAAHALGIARRAIDELCTLAGAKPIPRTDRRQRDRTTVQAEVGRALALVASARAYVLAAIADLWETVQRGAAPDQQQQVNARQAMTLAVRNAAEAVDLMYEAAGGSAIYEQNPLERCFRDIHVATQHAAVATSTYEIAGRVRLGLDPGAPFIL